MKRSGMETAKTCRGLFCEDRRVAGEMFELLRSGPYATDLLDSKGGAGIFLALLEQEATTQNDETT